jgi:hypothetical protein
MTVPSRGPSSTIPLAGHPKRSGVLDGSDFLPYPTQSRIDHNKQVSVGLGGRSRTTVGTAQYEGARRFRIQHSPQSEAGQGARLAPRRRLHLVGQKGFKGFMQLTRWSEGVPRRKGREESGVYWVEALSVTQPFPRPPMGLIQRSRMCARHSSATPPAQ